MAAVRAVALLQTKIRFLVAGILALALLLVASPCLADGIPQDTATQPQRFLPPRIEGSSAFVQRTEWAMKWAEKAGWGDYINQNLALIKEDPTLPYVGAMGLAADGRGAAVFKSASDNLWWYASALVHEATHARDLAAGKEYWGPVGEHAADLEQQKVLDALGSNLYVVRDTSTISPSAPPLLETLYAVVHDQSQPTQAVAALQPTKGAAVPEPQKAPSRTITAGAEDAMAGDPVVVASATAEKSTEEGTLIVEGEATEESIVAAESQMATHAVAAAEDAVAGGQVDVETVVLGTTSEPGATSEVQGLAATESTTTGSEAAPAAETAADPSENYEAGTDGPFPPRASDS